MVIRHILLLLFSLLYLVRVGQCNVSANHIEGRLISDLLQNYTKEARPITDPHSVLNVTLTFVISKIDSLDEKNQVFTSFGWIKFVWIDDFLQWNPADYEHIFKVVLRGEEIWLPEIAVKNAVDSGVDLSYKTPYRVTVINNGEIYWIPAFKWKTMCNVNLKYFPFDAHTCQVIFVNWMYGANMVDFIVNDEIDFDEPNIQGEWAVKKLWTFQRYLLVDDNYPIPYVGFQVTMSRLPAYFLCNVIVPCILMTVMSMMSYLLPCESGEKISLSITVLLSYSVILLMVSELTPRTAKNIPLITTYIITSMSLTGISLLANIYVLNLHHHSGRTAPPHWLKFILLKCAAPLVCARTSRVQLKTQGSVSPADWLNVFNSRTKLVTKKKETSSVMSQSDVEVEEMDKHKTGSHLARSPVELPQEAMRLIRLYLDKEREITNSEQNQYEWQLMSKVLDRVFSIISLLFVIISTVAYFIQCLD